MASIKNNSVIPSVVTISLPLPASIASPNTPYAATPAITNKNTVATVPHTPFMTACLTFALSVPHTAADTTEATMNTPPSTRPAIAAPFNDVTTSPPPALIEPLVHSINSATPNAYEKKVAAASPVTLFCVSLSNLHTYITTVAINSKTVAASARAEHTVPATAPVI